MPLRRFLLIVIVLLLAPFGWWAYPELRLQIIEYRYSQELRPGMTRQAIENRLLAEGIRFFPKPPDADFVSAGDEVRLSLVCARREVGLLLHFDADILRSIRRVREERGCM